VQSADELINGAGHELDNSKGDELGSSSSDDAALWLHWPPPRPIAPPPRRTRAALGFLPPLEWHRSGD